MTHFKLPLSVSLALIMSLVLATSVVSAPNSQMFTPSGLTAELCGDAVCLNWTPTTSEYDFQQISVWEGDRNVSEKYIVGTAADYDSHATLPLNILDLFLKLKFPEYSDDTVTYSFKVFALKNSYVDKDGWTVHGITGVWHSNLVTLEVPRQVAGLNVNNIGEPGQGQPEE